MVDAVEYVFLHVYENIELHCSTYMFCICTSIRGCNIKLLSVLKLHPITTELPRNNHSFMTWWKMFLTLKSEIFKKQLLVSKTKRSPGIFQWCWWRCVFPLLWAAWALIDGPLGWMCLTSMSTRPVDGRCCSVLVWCWFWWWCFNLMLLVQLAVTHEPLFRPNLQAVSMFFLAGSRFID